MEIWFFFPISNWVSNLSVIRYANCLIKRLLECNENEYMQIKSLKNPILSFCERWVVSFRSKKNTSGMYFKLFSHFLIEKIANYLCFFLFLLWARCIQIISVSVQTLIKVTLLKIASFIFGNCRYSFFFSDFL